MINLNIFFDLDGTIYEWKEIPVNAENMVDMSAEEKQRYCTEEIYKMLTSPGYYKNLQPYPKMLALAKELCTRTYNTNIGIVSCSINENTTLDKREAIKRDMPFMEEEHVFFLQDGLGKDKAKVIQDAFGQNPFGEGEITLNILIDDHTPNLLEFEKKSANNLAIKCRNPINGKKGVWKGATVFYDAEVEENIKLINQAIAKHLRQFEKAKPSPDMER